MSFAGITFSGPLAVREVLRDRLGDSWELTEPLSVSWNMDSGHRIPDGRIDVPIGFVTDLASIPRFLRSIIPVVGRQNRPAVVHDYCYVRRIGRREDTDRLFLDSMQAVGVSWPKRWVMYLAVRAFGGWAWGT